MILIKQLRSLQKLTSISRRQESSIKASLSSQLCSYSQIRNQGISVSSLEHKESIMNMLPSASADDLLQMAKVLVEDRRELEDIGGQLIQQAIQLIQARQAKVNVIVQLLPDLLPHNPNVSDKQINLLATYILKNIDILSLSGVTMALLAFCRLSKENKQYPQLVSQLCALSIGNMGDMDLNQLCIIGESVYLVEGKDSMFWVRFEALLEQSSLVDTGNVQQMAEVILRLAEIEMNNDQLWDRLVDRYLEGLVQILQGERGDLTQVVIGMSEVITAGHLHPLDILQTLQKRLQNMLERLLGNCQISQDALYHLTIALSMDRSVSHNLWSSIQAIIKIDGLSGEQCRQLLIALCAQSERLPENLWRQLEDRFVMYSAEYSHEQIVDLSYVLRKQMTVTHTLQKLFDLHGCLAKLD